MSSHQPSPLVMVDNLAFHYEATPILNGISLALHPGEVVSLIGGSGTGKTTLLKILSGLLAPQNGRVLINNESMPMAQHQVAFMMQQDLLLPWRTVLDNALLAAAMSPHDPSQLRERALQLLNDLEMLPHIDLFPDSLSGGMRQRVALARVLLQQRPLLLLDEPFASLDVLLREQLYHLLRRLSSQMGLTIFLVTHDFRDALILSDRILCLTNGRVSHEWIIPPNVHHNAATMGAWQEQLRSALSTKGEARTVFDIFPLNRFPHS